ncbi:MAG: trypsin-like peptidase domain-containing protein [Candidatus Ryanbacteria bacterium]|nr:trypsin-like peptidase domain-containing protein [Candidatus Ryanbacteria bacterium]
MEDLTKTQVILLLVLVSVVVAFSTAIVTATLFEQAPASAVTQTIQRVVERAVGEPPAGTTEKLSVVTQEQRIVQVVKDSSPAVVSVIATKDLPVVEQCTTVSPFGDDSFFGQFFPEFQVPQLCQRGTERRQVSAGTGFFVRADGIIVTNRHVVQDKDASYTVIMNDASKLAAEVVARDPLEDVAILRVKGNNFPSLALGDAGGLEAGQTVIAIGNALGEFQNTVSVGVVSGLRRTVVASGEELRSVIQTDAAINPGNSGGPLMNLDGKVIGVNTAIATNAQSIGFALPINIVKNDLAKVEKQGKIVYPFLGVQYQIIDKALQEDRKLPTGEGALIVSEGGSGVTPGSPAEKAGLKNGDIIIELGGEKITRQNTLAEIIQKHNVGDTVSLKYIRDGKENTIQLALIERKF